MLKEKRKNLSIAPKDLRTKLSDFQSQFDQCINEKEEISYQCSSLQIQHKEFVAKILDLETKLHKRCKTDQTIFLNKPKEFTYFYKDWGIGYDNPHYLKMGRYKHLLCVILGVLV